MTEVPVKIIKKNGKVVEPDDWMYDPIKADKWANLYFTKSGKSIIGYNTYNTQEEALKMVKRNRKTGLPVSGETWMASDGVSRPMSEYSHAIQIPVKS